jgi:hypothetical protein
VRQALGTAIPRVPHAAFRLPRAAILGGVGRGGAWRDYTLPARLLAARMEDLAARVHAPMAVRRGVTNAWFQRELHLPLDCSAASSRCSVLMRSWRASGKTTGLNVGRAAARKAIARLGTPLPEDGQAFARCRSG